MRNRVQRSWLIAPANDDARLAAAADSGADVVVLDLQDTVHETNKHEARARVKDAISEMRARGSEVYVRCDPELLYADFAASVWRGLHGVVLPGLTTAEQVREADWLLGEFEAARGVVRPPPLDEIREADDPRGPEQALEIHLCLDTGRANWDAEDLITASARMRSVSLGRADLTMDLREEPSGDLHLLPYLNQRLIIVANACGVRPIGAWWRATSRGLAATPEETLRAAVDGRRAGFRGALCIRADQARALNEGFTPTAGEVAQATGAAIDPNASSDERAIALDTLAWAEACKDRDSLRVEA